MNDASETNGQGHNAHAFVRQLGRQQAEAFDLRLKEIESREREQRLSAAAWKPRVDRATWDDEEDSLKIVQLEARNSELTAYKRAIDDSLPWRIIQGIRRFFGRAW